MRSYDFDRQIERRNTRSLKYDFAAERGMPADVLPLWVADMDFQSPPEVIAALEARSRHGIFGYTNIESGYVETVRLWYRERHGWDFPAAALTPSPGVVFALCAAIRALTREGDAVMIQTPVYYPFFSSVRGNGRRLVTNPLIYENGTYRIDFEDFERKITEERVRLFILCSPHNPVGRVWTREELIRLGELCRKHGVLVVADEIHSDFVYPGHHHTVFAGISPEFADMSVTCTAPSKTFNLAGLQISNIIITNPELRSAFRREIRRTGYDEPNAMGVTACEAAYLYGAPWLDALLSYLESNTALVRRLLAERLPKARLVEPEGTYLLWVDFRGYSLDPDRLEELVVQKAGLWLDSGPIFGPEGAGFQRFNIACPAATLKEAFRRLGDAFQGL